MTIVARGAAPRSQRTRTEPPSARRPPRAHCAAGEPRRSRPPRRGSTWGRPVTMGQYPRRPRHLMVGEPESQQQLPPASVAGTLGKATRGGDSLAADGERAAEALEDRKRLRGPRGPKPRLRESAALADQVIVPVDEIDRRVIPATGGDVEEQVGLEDVSGSQDQNEVAGFAVGQKGGEGPALVLRGADSPVWKGLAPQRAQRHPKRPACSPSTRQSIPICISASRPARAAPAAARGSSGAAAASPSNRVPPRPGCVPAASASVCGPRRCAPRGRSCTHDQRRACPGSLRRQPLELVRAPARPRTAPDPLIGLVPGHGASR